MKKSSYKAIAALCSALLLTSACSKSFLEVKPTGTDLEANYYKNETEAYNGLIAVYDVVGWQGGGFVTKVGAMDAGSDDQLAGGGGPNDITDFQVISNYTLDPATGPHNELWKAGFSGVFRANFLLEKLPDVPMDEGHKARFTAEAKFLRAYFYFDLVRQFKNVPLFTKPVPVDQMYDQLQVPPADVYKQIEQDLKDAIAASNLPDQVTASTDGGRITKGTAHALLGKVYLFEKNWSAAAAELALVNGTPGQQNPTYGYKLLDNFADLWTTIPDLKFNSESIFEVSHASMSNGNWGCIACTEGNVLDILTGPRGYAPGPDAPGYEAGYGFLIVTKDLATFMKGDPRYNATIADLDSMKANGIADYSPSFNNTGFFLNKFIGYVKDETKGPGDKPLNFAQNIYEIRLADTYLMEAEALANSGDAGGAGGRAYALLNAVRARVKLPPVPATLDNIRKERRMELAGEGHRWFDIIRWGIAADVLKDRGFKPGKNEILPIPLLELNNTKLRQSKEYGGDL